MTDTHTHLKTGCQIVLATSNAKKCREMRPALQPLGFDLVTLADVGSDLDVQETGQTFMENAHLKAQQQAQHLGRWCIGEDSGLSVPALDGAPGIFSARYSDPGATDSRNNEKLLAELSDLPAQKRKAYYTSTMALANPAGEIVAQSEGRCWGRIIDSYRGEGGFGYDPLFEIPEYHRTFAELGDTVKTVLSHRGRALRDFIAQLLRIVAT